MVSKPALISPLSWDTPIVDKTGRPTLEFQRKWAALKANTNAAAPAVPALTHGHVFVGNASNIAGDVAMSGDATISDTGALTLANTAVTAASYGDSSHYTTFTVDAKGRLTAAASVALPTVPSAANPTASVGLTAVNGSSANFMRADAAPALDVSISPTWSGNHTWSNSLTVTKTGAGVSVTLTGEGSGGFTSTVYGANNPLSAFLRGRGTTASAAVPNNADNLGVLRFRGWVSSGPTFGTGGELRFTAKEATWSSTANGTTASVWVCAASSTTLVETIQLEAEHQQLLGPVRIGSPVTTAPVASAIFELVSTTQGFLTPRMTTTQRTAISSPADGLEVYDTTLHAKFVNYNGTWTQLGGGASGANPSATASDTAVNGSASTFMRSDAAPAVQKGSSSQFGIVKADGTTITASGGVLSAAAGAPGFSVGFQGAGYFTCPFCIPNANIIIGANTLFATPFYVSKPTTFSKMGVHVVTGAAAKSVELGIFDNTGGGGGFPGAKVYDAGSVSVATSNADAEITGLTLTLSPGLYWFAHASDGSPTLSGSTTDIGGWIGRDHGAGFPNLVAGVTGSWTFSAGNLPASFPSPVYKSTSISLAYLRL